MSATKARLSESQTLRERATNCRRLAAGVGDAAFAGTLNKLAEECEAKAALADRTSTACKTLNENARLEGPARQA